MNTLSLYEWMTQLRQYGFMIDCPPTMSENTPVVIRAEEGDCGVAAVHVTEGRLVIDLGGKR